MLGRKLLRPLLMAGPAAVGALGVACGSNNSPSSDGGLDSTFLDSGADAHGQTLDGSSGADGNHALDGTAKDSNGSDGNTTSSETGSGDSTTSDSPGNDAKSSDSGSDARSESGADAGSTMGTDSGADAGAAVSVLQYHLNANRDGHYVDPLMTPTAAAKLKIDTSFSGTLTPPSGGVAGTVWSQPLFVANGVNGKGTFYVADDADNVYALDETSGDIVWSKLIDTPASSYGSGCGNDPGSGFKTVTGAATWIGVTGTPIIDLPSRTMFLVAVHAAGTNMPISTYKIHALSIDTGDEVTNPAGWPIDVSTITSSSPAGTGVKFNPQPQIQRSALALVNGYLYVPFGGELGDCGTYHGWVISVQIASPSGSGVTGFATGTDKAGIWGVGGLSSDGTDVFAATSNGTSSSWAENESIIRFHNGTTFGGSSATTDFFSPYNWQDLDTNDLDLGGTGPLVLDIAGTTPSSLVVAYGKSGLVHVLDRSNLGGILGSTAMGNAGQGVYSAQVTSAQIRNGPVAYTSLGVTYTAFGQTNVCSGGDLLALKFATSGTPSYTQAWCANTGSQGSPMVTTTDAAGLNPIVWMSGGTVTAWNGTTGANIFDGGAITLQNVSKWTTPIEVKGRIFVGAGTQLYALTTQ